MRGEDGPIEHVGPDGERGEHDYTVANWAAKWSGLVRRRRNAAGYDVADGW